MHSMRPDQWHGVVCRQEAMLAAMSEKDANIALLELLPHKKTGNIDEVEKLMREKRQLQQELRQLVSKIL